ncbi:hypothetical protein [Leptolyngbya sp. 7M]|uniref:hypothetical protein n=1 Tax=Leptolyngbya sp. 7M TaxID=2812896 RepID=UPI001B8B1DAF|nr:hypothetical protein [Leptolyngbya sp. 7M]QYO65089.1 hypothetical protein JVX88_37235 [Leptolyngbya sp. 7M]
MLNLLGDADPEYNLFPMNDFNDIIGFCSRTPTINDIATGYPEYVRQAALYELQRRWSQNCQCIIPERPGCDDPRYAGRGQCACVLYDFSVTALVCEKRCIARVSR